MKICHNTAAGLVSGGTVPGVPPSTYYVLGGPGKLFKADLVGAGLATHCTRMIRTEGIIQCGGDAQKVNYSQCADHMPTASNGPGTTSSGACSGTVCGASTTNAAAEVKDPNEPDAEIIGGKCVTLNPTGGAAGDGFVNLTFQIALAPPGDNCLNPATYVVPGFPTLVAVTTGTATAKLLNQDSDGITPSGAELDSDPVTGAVFNCSTLAFGQTSGVKLVGAFPAINSLEVPLGSDVFLDSTTTFVLKYE